MITLVGKHKTMLRMCYHCIIIVVVRKDLPGFPVVEDYVAWLRFQHLSLLENCTPVNCIWSFESIVTQTCLKVDIAGLGKTTSSTYFQKDNGLIKK